ncbi:tryptophan-rich sensory protein [Francisella sp. Scap27]|uniref:TspO/MBR family protein n=1 Tax=Francisella sp. Scap27 TaxID=2589986 RepID=UPI0015BB9EB2|nr:TspO/MBR family protein [Francisella sp. Scap27]QLE78485.1 tryptophan-rich sensory protein [Francisella sp. Scap27]
MKNIKAKDWGYLVLFITIVLGLGFLVASATTTQIQGWYSTINHPSFSPPNYIFAPIWTILYIMIAIAGWLICLEGKLVKKIFIVYKTQFVLNFLWSIIFFSFHEIGLALVEISVLWVFIVWNIRLFANVSKVASYLMVPYILWVSFAWVLNASYFMLN